MVMTPVLCPHCGTDNVRKNGHSKSGKQNFLCDNKDCARKTFILEYTYKAYDPVVRASVYEHIVNGNGTRATARLLGISKNTVTDLLKKQNS
jgi:transposase-like protein